MEKQSQLEDKNVTQVTSIAEEEKRTGQKINTPSAEELVARASSSLIVNTKKLESLIIQKQNGANYKISRKGMNRVLLSILNLPTGGLPVNLKSEEEKLAFAIGQKLIADRFILMQNHISQELQKAKKEQEILTNSENNSEEKGDINE